MTNNAPMKTRRSSVRWALALIVAAAAGQAWADGPIVIKFSHVVAVDTPKGQAAAFFAKRVEELTRGQVKVEVYPNSQLYKDKEELQALQLGAVQMLAPSLSKFAPLGVKEFEVFDLPFLFNDYAELHRVTQGTVGKSLLSKLEAQGITGLAYWDNGFKVFTANKPLKKPADFKGLRMRIQSSRVLMAQMQALGAEPQVMAFSETYQALQSRMLDGTENPPSNLYTQKMHEVQKHLTVSNHGYLGYALVVNKRFWDGLPARLRSLLIQAVDESTKVANDQAFVANRDALASVKAAGKTEIHTPTPDELLAFKKALLPLHGQMTSRVGQDTLQAIYRETGFKPLARP